MDYVVFSTTVFVVGPLLKKHAVLPEVACDVCGSVASALEQAKYRTKITKCHRKHEVYTISRVVKAGEASSKGRT